MVNMVKQAVNFLSLVPHLGEAHTNKKKDKVENGTPSDTHQQ